MSRNTTRRSTTRTRAAAAERKTRTIRTASGNPFYAIVYVELGIHEVRTPGEKVSNSLRLDRLKQTTSPRERRGLRPPIGRRTVSAAP